MREPRLNNGTAHLQALSQATQSRHSVSGAHTHRAQLLHQAQNCRATTGANTPASAEESQPGSFSASDLLAHLSPPRRPLKTLPALQALGAAGGRSRRR